jgi:Xaa-Pro aminopeptidase
VYKRQELVRDEAAKSGLCVKTWSEFDLQKIMENSSDQLERGLSLFKNVCKRLGIVGNMSFYGFGEISKTYQMLKKIDESGVITMITEMENSVIDNARIKKDLNEIEILKDVNLRAQSVMNCVKNYLKNCTAVGELIKNSDGKTVTIGMVKEIIRSETLNKGLVIKEEFIFSQGRDSAIPHSIGDESANLLTGKTVVFDYFPHDNKTGYYADITRTWCLGYVPSEVKKIYDDVIKSYDLAISSIKIDRTYKELDEIVSRNLASKGHPTLLQEGNINEGYFHSLGHGIGLQLHENPSLFLYSNVVEFITPGHVFTIEPGIYYPDKEIGVRIEDDITILDDGSVYNLTSLSKDILIPLK